MHQACDLVFPCSVLSGSVCTAVNSMADYNAAGALITARSGKVARRPSMKRRHSFDLSKRRSFLTAPGRKSLDVRPHCSSLAGVHPLFFWQCIDICHMSGACAFKPFRELFHCASSCQYGFKGMQTARNPFIPYSACAAHAAVCERDDEPRVAENCERHATQLLVQPA